MRNQIASAAAAAAAVLMTTATTAFAGNVVPATPDPVVVTPAPAPVTVGDWTGPYFGATAGWATGETVGVDNFDGVLYGAFAGYNYQFDNDFVLGAEIAGSTGQLTYDLGGTSDPTLIDLKARAGFAVDRALVYVSGGYTFATYAGGNEGDGFNLGAGVDFMVTDNVFVGVEYVYRDIEDRLATPAAWQDQFHTIQARIGFTF